MEERKPFEILSITDVEQCVPEFKDSVQKIRELCTAIRHIRTNLLNHLGEDYLSYDISIDGIEYKIRPAFTEKEIYDQLEMKKKIFSVLMKYSLSKFIDEFDKDLEEMISDEEIFKFILHPMRIESHEALQDRLAKDKEISQEDTKTFSKDYEAILKDNPRYFLEQAYSFIHKGPDSIDEELLEFASFRRVLHNYMMSKECSDERDRLFNMKTVTYFPELIDKVYDVSEDIQ